MTGIARPLLALPLALTIGTAALGQTAVVRSGEHEGFTRIVVTYPGATGWDLIETDGGYTLRAEDAPVRYDTSDAFRRILRERVSEISGAPGSHDLDVSLACDCEGTASAFRPNIVVIDFRARSPENNSGPTQAPIPTTTPAVPLAGDGAFSWRSWRGAESAPQPLASGPVASPEPEFPVVPVAQPAPAQEPEPASETVLTNPAFAGLPIPRIGVRIGNAALETDNELQSTCIPNSRLFVGTWSKMEDTPDEVARSAHALLRSEANSITEESLIGAANSYLAYGLGAEARQLLRISTIKDEKTATMRAVSHIFENETPPSPGFAGMESCDGEAAFWSVLERETLRKAENINGGAIFRTYSALSPRLRSVIHARLIDRLTAAEAHAALSDIRKFAELTDPQADPAAPAVSQRSPDEPQKLVAEVDQAYRGRMPLPDSRLKTLEALTVQYRRSDIVGDLRRAVVAGRALAGDFDGAALALADAPDAGNSFLTLLAESNNDDALLRHALDAALYPPVSISEPTARRMFQRLADLGFSAEALGWAALIPSEAQEEPLKIRIAEAFLRNRQPQTALITVAGASEAANRVREEAWRMLGQPQTETPPDGVDMSRAFWREQRDWNQVVARDAAPWVAATAMANGRPPAEEQTLTDVNDLLSHTNESRQTISDLLEKTPVN